MPASAPRCRRPGIPSLRVGDLNSSRVFRDNATSASLELRSSSREGVELHVDRGSVRLRRESAPGYVSGIPRFVLALRILGLACLPVLGGEPPTPNTPVHPRHEESVLVERVLWPVILEARNGASAEECLDPTRIRVHEDGQIARVLRVERGQESVLQVLLLDISGSMTVGDRFDSAKAGVRDFLDEFPLGARLAVMSFDSDFRLLVPPTIIRSQRAKALIWRRIEGTSINWGTSLRDLTYRLAQHLLAMPERKAVVLLTDGEDPDSTISADVARGFLASAPDRDFAIFPVRIGLASSPRDDSHREARALLKDLASSTGGTFFEYPEDGSISEAFDAVRRWLDLQAVVIYVPETFGEGPNDPPDVPYRFRRVKITSTDRRCRVKTLKTERCAGRCTDEPMGGTLPDDESEGLTVLNLPPEWNAYEDRTELRTEPGGLIVRTVDTVRDSGFLYPDEKVDPKGILPPEIHLEPTHALRTVRVNVPSIEEAQEYYRSPEDVYLRKMLGLDEVDTVNGKTVFWLWSELVRAMYERYPEYQAWTAERLEAETRDEVRGLLTPELRALLPVGVSEEEYLDLAVEARLREPRPTDLGKYLGAWLEDVPARDLAFRIDTRLANALLSAESEGDAGKEGLVHLAASRWSLLRSWLPAPTHVRVVAPLQPIYDAEEDRFGFFRVILPRPEREARPRDPVPEEPWGFRVVERLLESPQAAEALRADWRVRSIEAREIGRKERPRVGGKKMRGPGVSVTLTLGPSGTLRAVFARGAEQAAPICLDAVGELEPVIAVSGLPRCNFPGRRQAFRID